MPTTGENREQEHIPVPNVGKRLYWMIIQIHCRRVPIAAVLISIKPLNQNVQHRMFFQTTVSRRRDVFCRLVFYIYSDK